MARSFTVTYDSAINTLALDRDLSQTIARFRNADVKNTAWRIARCCDDINIWFVNSPENGWLHGRFWKCHSKLCSYCLSDESRRRRRQLKLAIQRHQETHKRSNWQFLTLTIENPHTTVSNTRQIVNQAWRNLRSRACFAAVEAGAKSEEFTLTANGYHYHIHSLLNFTTKPIYQEWRRHWTECVDKCGGQSNRLFGHDTVDGYLIAKFKPVKKPSELTNELCKYVTKSTSFRSLDKTTIIELAEQKRWHRMFELLGSLRQKHTDKTTHGTERASIVHKKRLFAGLHTDRQRFEEQRAANRYFQIDHLENTFNSRVWTLPEIRTVITNQQAGDQ